MEGRARGAWRVWGGDGARALRRGEIERAAYRGRLGPRDACEAASDGANGACGGKM